MYFSKCLKQGKFTTMYIAFQQCVKKNWEEDFDGRNNTNGHFLKGLGYYGLKIFDEGENALNKALIMDSTH